MALSYEKFEFFYITLVRHNTQHSTAGAVTYFFLTYKVLFSQVGVITKFLNSTIFKYFELMEYFDDV